MQRWRDGEMGKCGDGEMRDERWEMGVVRVEMGEVEMGNDDINLSEIRIILKIERNFNIWYNKSENSFIFYSETHNTAE